MEPTPASIWSLCWKCFRLLRQLTRANMLISEGKITFLRSWKQLAQRSSKGCEFCIMIASKVERLRGTKSPATYFDLKRTGPLVSGKILEFQLCQGGFGPKGKYSGDALATLADLETLRVEIRAQDEGVEQWTQIEEFNIAAAADNPAAKYVHRRPRVYDIASDSSFREAEEWLTICGKSHDICPPLKPVLLPTRVIDVGGSASTHQKLFTTDGMWGHYTALSYCWGAEPQPLVTTKLNVKMMSEGILTSSLAKTIQDAITVTRKLGIRYIWIDALCIIQDSQDDKDIQLQRMGDIYETSVITIIAASAQSCSEGFLQRRSYPWGVQDWKTFKLPFRCPNGKRGELICEPEDPYFTGDQPINKRAWTLQEFLLPPRKLVYSTTQLIWQCRSVQTELGGRAKKFEDIKAGVRNGLIKVQISPTVLLKAISSTPTNSEITAELLHDVRFNWQNLVTNYTGRSLTNREDTLPGISGIASKFFDALKEDYKAGLWYSESDPSNFVNEMLWNVRQATITSPIRSNSYMAPSWSWAGQPYPVEFPISSIKTDVVCSIVECSVELASVALFGQVKGGSLKVKAMTAKIDPKRNDGKPPSLKYILEFLYRDDVAILLDDTIENLEAKLATGPIWCLLLTMSEGLLITPLDGKRWRRIGVFRGRNQGGVHTSEGIERFRSFSEWFRDRQFEEVNIL